MVRIVEPIINKNSFEILENCFFKINIPTFEKVIYKSSYAHDAVIAYPVCVEREKNTTISFKLNGSKVTKEIPFNVQEILDIKSGVVKLYLTNNKSIDYSLVDDIKNNIKIDDIIFHKDYYIFYKGLIHLTAGNGKQNLCYLELHNDNAVKITSSNVLFTSEHAGNFFIFNDKLNNHMAIAGTSKTGGISLFNSINFLKWEEETKIINGKDLLKHPLKFYLDSLNTVIYDHFSNQYLLYARHNKRMGLRLIQLFKSRDLLNWSKPTEIKFINAPSNFQVYSPEILQYPNSPYFIGILTNMVASNRNSKTIILMFSNNGSNFELLSNNFLQQSKKNSNMSGYGLVNSPDNKRFQFYINSNMKEIHSYSIRKHGFGCIYSKENIGIFKTKRLHLNSFEIYLNFKTISNNGYVIVEIYDYESNNIIFESEKFVGDEINKLISDDNKKPGDVYLKFILSHAEIYSINYDILI